MHIPPRKHLNLIEDVARGGGGVVFVCFVLIMLLIARGLMVNYLLHCERIRNLLHRLHEDNLLRYRKLPTAECTDQICK